MATFRPKTQSEIDGVLNGTGGATRANTGDIVVLPAGTFEVDARPLPGVLIGGQGSSRTTLKGNFEWDGNGDLVNVGTLVGLTVDMDGASDVGSAYGMTEFRDGIFALDDVVFTNASKNNFTALTMSTDCKVYAKNCKSLSAGGVGFEMASPNGYRPSSVLLLHQCDADDVYDYVVDDNFVPCSVYGGTFENNHNKMMLGQTINIYGATIYKDGVIAVEGLYGNITGCSFISRSTSISYNLFYPYGNMLSDCTFTNTASGKPWQIPLYISGFTMTRCTVNGGYVRLWLGASNVTVSNNNIFGQCCSVGGGLWVAGNASGSWTVEGNMIHDCYNNIYYEYDNSAAFTLGGDSPEKGNLIYNAVVADIVTTTSGGGSTNWSGSDYNIIETDPTPDYTPQAHDAIRTPTAAEIAAYEASTAPQPYTIPDFDTLVPAEVVAALEDIANATSSDTSTRLLRKVYLPRLLFGRRTGWV